MSEDANLSAAEATRRAERMVMDALLVLEKTTGRPVTDLSIRSTEYQMLASSSPQSMRSVEIFLGPKPGDGWRA